MHNLLMNCLEITTHLISSHFTEAGENLFYSQMKQAKAFLVLIYRKLCCLNEDSNTLKMFL